MKNFALPAPVFAQNLLKNGSFEGGTRYWYENGNTLFGTAILKSEAPSGEYAIRLNKGKNQ